MGDSRIYFGIPPGLFPRNKRMGRRLPVYPCGIRYACYMGNCHIYQLLFTQKKQDRYRDFLCSVVGGHYDLHKPYIFENPIYVGVILMIDLQKTASHWLNVGRVLLPKMLLLFPQFRNPRYTFITVTLQIFMMIPSDKRGVHYGGKFRI